MPINKLRKQVVVVTDASNNGAEMLAGGISSTPMKNIYPLTTIGGSGAVSSVDVSFSSPNLTVTVDGVTDTVALPSGGATNLTYTASPTQGLVNSDTGTDATLPLATGTNAGLMGPAQFTQLSNVTITQPVDLDALETASHAAVTVTDTATIDFTLTGQAISAIVIDDSITNVKLADMAANTVKVNATAALANPTDIALSASQLLGRGQTGNIAPITLGSGLTMTGTTLSASATGNITETVNGGRFTYQILSGTPVLTFDKTNPLTPTLTVAGGTIRLIEVRDTITTAVSVNPVYTFNATWADAIDVDPSYLTKKTVSSGQYDIDNTPQVIYSSTGTTQSVVTINAVASDMKFIIGWNNQ